MPLAQRKRVILVKPEATYGSDSSPTTTDAILCSNLDLTPLDGSSTERDFIRPYFGASGSIRVENFSRLTFDVELAGSGTAGTAPPWGHLLKSCNFSETVTGSAVTGTAQAGATAAITLAAGESAVDDFYTGMTIDLTGGTGSGQKREIISYVGSTKVATVATDWTTTPDATSQYSIGENVMYLPNSDFGTATANTASSIYFNVDGVRHILLGARGTFSMDLSAKQIAKISFTFTGLLGTISDQSLPAADFSAFQTPVTVSTANTTDINLLGFNSAVLENLSFDIANNVIYRQLIGTESVLITDRKPTGNVSLEATTVTAQDWWTIAKDATFGVFAVKHGQTAGNIIGVTAPNLQLVDPSYADSDGVAMMNFGMAFTPKGSAGNDEIRICVK